MRAFPCSTAVASAPSVSSSGVSGSNRANEDVNVVQPQPGQALIEAREEVLPGSPLTVRTRPHVVPGFRRDDQLIAIATQVAGKDAAEVLLGRRCGRSCWRDRSV